MTIEKTQFDRNTFAFSYKELAELGFDGNFVQDYLDQVKNIQEVAESNDEVIDQVNTNTADIAQNKQDIQANSDRLDIIEPIVADNTDRLDIVEPIVSDNTDRLDVVEPIVADNTDRLDIAEPKITANTDAIALATGQLVGNMDYATTSIGGVVDLAALVADLTQIATADIAAAPVAYDQTYTQLVTDLTNENKGKINEIVLKVNEIIAGQILSKQMSSI